MTKGELVTVYVPKPVLDRLDEYAHSKLLSRGRAIVSILIEAFELGGGEGSDKA